MLLFNLQYLLHLRPVKNWLAFDLRLHAHLAHRLAFWKAKAYLQLPEQSDEPAPPNTALPNDGNFLPTEAGLVVNGLIGNEAEQCGGDKPGDEVTTPLKAEPAGATAGGRSGSSPISQFPNRASWLAKRLQERSWNKHDVERKNGPRHKTVQKILNGQHVREDVLKKLAEALSAAPPSLKLPPIDLLGIPPD
jgi:hypothetical protein